MNLNSNVELTLNKPNTITCNVQKELYNATFKWIIASSSYDFLLKKNENYISINATHTDALSSQVNILGDFDLDNKALICIIEHKLLEKSYSKPAKIEIKRKWKDF